MIKIPVPIPSSEIRLAFVRAVMKPNTNAMLIDQHHHSAGWCSVEAAVTKDACFAVEVADHVLAVDCDDGDVSVVNEFRASVRSHGLHPVPFASGGGLGRRHVFVVIEDDALRQVLAKEAVRLNLDVRRGQSLIRPPFTKHHTGGRSELRVLKSPEKALELLTIPDARCPLSPRMNVLLRHGDVYRQYTSRSEVVQAIVASARTSAVAFANVISALLDPRNVGGDRVREEDRRGRAHQYVQLCWECTDELPSDKPSSLHGPLAVRIIKQMRAGAEALSWPGRSGTTDYMVLMAHLNVAEEAQHLCYTASERQIAERSGLCRRTVGTAHKLSFPRVGGHST